MRAQARRLMIRAFVKSFLTIGEDTFNNAAASYRACFPNANANTSKVEGWRMMEEPDVKEEMERQLRAIDKAADLDDQWVYDRWRAIANANIFDYMSVTAEGIADFTTLDPTKLTLEQQLCIEEIHLDKSGRITKLKLASKNQAVANVARARQMIDGKRDLGAVDLAQRITERMNRAAARIGRVFDNDTGQQV
jgi:terminase small subunit-like protein